MMEITVYGTPAPQGSKRFLGLKGGKGIMVESSKAVKPWREAVKWAAIEWRKAHMPHINASMGIPGPINLEVIFTLVRPKSAKAGAFPSKRPDLSKLIRSTEDSLTDAGVWVDDARVIRIVAAKLYVGAPGAMDVPGARIRVMAA